MLLRGVVGVDRRAFRSGRDRPGLADWFWGKRFWGFWGNGRNWGNWGNRPSGGRSDRFLMRVHFQKFDQVFAQAIVVGMVHDRLAFAWAGEIDFENIAHLGGGPVGHHDDP